MRDQLEMALRVIEVLCEQIDKQHGLLRKYGSLPAENAVTKKAREMAARFRKDAGL